MIGFARPIDAFIAVAAAIITLAIIAVVVAPNSQASQVIKTVFNGLANLIRKAVSPLGG